MELTVKHNEANIVDAYWNELRPLSAKVKLKLAALLTTAVLEEESLREEALSKRRVAKVVRRSNNSPTDVELQARFAGKDVPEQPEDPEWNLVIKSNMGKTIKPVEKWL